MSDLDDKLREVLDVVWNAALDYSSSPDLRNQLGVLDEEKYLKAKKNTKSYSIAQIHHAFRDSGYRFVPKQEDIQHLIDDGTFSPLETGQEWFGRFMKEIQITSDIKRRAGADHKVYTDEAIEAAKRASGLEGEASLSTDQGQESPVDNEA